MHIVETDSIATQLAAACEDWLRCKAQEDAARNERLDIETIIDRLVGHKEEGAETHEAGPYRCTLTGKLTRTWDLERLEQIIADIPEALRPVRQKLEVDLHGIRWLENNEPEVYRTLTSALTVKPAKTAITVKLIQEAA